MAVKIDKSDRITIRDHTEEFRTIVKQENRLSKCSKFFKHNNKYYESKYVDNAYMGLSYFAYVFEIKDIKKIEILKEKFQKNKKKENKGCQQMAKDMAKNAYDLEVFINAEIHRYKMTNNCRIDIFTQEYNNIRTFYNFYKNTLEKIKEKYNNKIVFCYLKRNNLIGFFTCENKKSVCGCYISAINYDIFSKYLKENNIFDEGIKERFEKEDDKNIDDLKYELDYIKEKWKEDIEENVILKYKVDNLIVDFNNLKEINRQLRNDNDRLETSNKEFRNKYNRFEIMDI